MLCISNVVEDSFVLPSRADEILFPCSRSASREPSHRLKPFDRFGSCLQTLLCLLTALSRTMVHADPVPRSDLCSCGKTIDVSSIRERLCEDGITDEEEIVDEVHRVYVSELVALFNANKEFAQGIPGQRLVLT